MEIGDILSDAFRYPLYNITSLIIYIILGIICGLAIGGTVAGILIGSSAKNIIFTDAIGILGILITIILGLLITGYELDIVKYGINRLNDGPGIDFARQVSNGVKLLIVNVVYFIIPVIISVILGLFLQRWLVSLITIFLIIIFAFAQFMGECRLAKTDNLNEALAINEAMADVARVGAIKVVTLTIILLIISFIIFFIVALIATQKGIIGGIGSILFGIASVYLSFVLARAKGLLYSDV